MLRIGELLLWLFPFQIGKYFDIRFRIEIVRCQLTGTVSSEQQIKPHGDLQTCLSRGLWTFITRGTLRAEPEPWRHAMNLRRNRNSTRVARAGGGPGQDLVTWRGGAASAVLCMRFQMEVGHSGCHINCAPPLPLCGQWHRAQFQRNHTVLFLTRGLLWTKLVANLR